MIDFCVRRERPLTQEAGGAALVAQRRRRQHEPCCRRSIRCEPLTPSATPTRSLAAIDPRGSAPLCDSINNNQPYSATKLGSLQRSLKLAAVTRYYSLSSFLTLIHRLILLFIHFVFIRHFLIIIRIHVNAVRNIRYTFIIKLQPKILIIVSVMFFILNR